MVQTSARAWTNATPEQNVPGTSGTRYLPIQTGVLVLINPMLDDHHKRQTGLNVSSRLFQLGIEIKL